MNRARKLNILQAAPLIQSIRPDMEYGSIERVIAYLDEAFIKAGHGSYIVSDKDSRISGTLIPLEDKESMLTNTDKYELQAKLIFDSIDRYAIDVIHLHRRNFLLTKEYVRQEKNLKVPILLTIHGPVKDVQEKYRDLTNVSSVHFGALSVSQKNDLSKLFKIEEAIYNGIPLGEFPFSNKKSNYLFSFGRIAKEKGQGTAIKVAKRLGIKLVVGGVVLDHDREYYEQEVKPYVDDKNVIFVGPLKDDAKKEYYKNALAFLMPIEWEDPCPLVVLEALACGTPVVGFRRGSLPELVVHGETGFIVDTANEMIQAIRNVRLLDPLKCRERIQQYFTSTKTAQDYIRLYERLVLQHQKS